MSRSRTNVTRVTADMAPTDLSRYARQMKDWGDSLPFGFMGFQVAITVDQNTGALAVGGTHTIVFDQSFHDTDGFFQDDKVVRIPPNCGGWYVFTAPSFIVESALATFGGWFTIVKNGNEAVGIKEVDGSNLVTPVSSEAVLLIPGDTVSLVFNARTAASYIWRARTPNITRPRCTALNGYRIALP